MTPIYRDSARTQQLDGYMILDQKSGLTGFTTDYSKSSTITEIFNFLSSCVTTLTKSNHNYIRKYIITHHTGFWWLPEIIKKLIYQTAYKALEILNLLPLKNEEAIQLTPQIREEIENFISSFLRPYIAGEITRKNEVPNRKPMIDLLLEKLGNVNDETRKAIIETAFDVYFEKIALGMYVFTKRRVYKGDITPESEEFVYIVNALRESVPKDFPMEQLSEEELIEKAVEALASVNAMRAQALKEANDYQCNEDRSLIPQKAAILQTGVLFIDSTHNLSNGN